MHIIYSFVYFNVTTRYSKISSHHKIFLKNYLPVPGRPPVKMLLALLGSITHHLQKFWGCSLLTAHCGGESQLLSTEMVAKFLTLFETTRDNYMLCRKYLNSYSYKPI
jgi:hypothetical protein